MRMQARLSVGFFGCALWLATNAYFGIRHDGRFYSLMAMRRLMPEAYTAEPWFVFGKQDGFSFFPVIFAQVVAGFGLGEASRWMTLAGGLVFVGGAFAFTRAARLGQFSTLAFLLLTSFPLAYCPNDWGILRLSESFLTARPFAVAASLAALAAHLRGREVTGWLLHGLALCLHPLMAVGAVVVSFGAKRSDRVVVASVILASMLMIALVFFDAPLLHAMDEAWFDLVAQSAVIAVMPGEQHDASLIAVAAAILLLGAMYGRPYLRRWYVLAVIVGFLGYAATLVASRFYPSTLILQVQSWRALWLTLVFALLALCDLASRWREVSLAGRLGLVLSGCLLLLFELGGGYGLLLSAIVLRIGGKKLSTFLEKLPLARVERVAWLVLLVTVATAIPNLLLLFDVIGGGRLVTQTELPDIVRGILLTGGFGLLAIAVWAMLRHLPAGVAIAFAIMAVSVALFFWDQRSAFRRALEGRYYTAATPEYFGDHLRQGDVVYWHGEPERVWFELRTSSYASSTQAVGIVFSEPLALEMRRRLGRVAQIGLPDEMFLDSRIDDSARLSYSLSLRHLIWPSNLHRWEPPAIPEYRDLTRTSLRYVCADPALDWVIDSAVFPELATARERLPVARGEETFALYDCRILRF